MTYAEAPPSDLPSFRALILCSLAGNGIEELDDNVDTAYPPFSFRLNADKLAAWQKEYSDFISKNEAEIFEAYRLFEDAASRRLFLDLLLFRLAGHTRIRLPTNTEAFWRSKREVSRLVAEQSNLTDVDSALMIERFLFDDEDGGVVLNCLRANVLFSFFLKQYYFSRDGVSISPQLGDHVVDAGGCFGDTAIKFARSVGGTGHVHVFDPLPMHVQIIEQNIRENNLENITIYPFGLGNVEQDGELIDSAINPGFRVSSSTPLRILDTLVEATVIDRVDFIKMDIEGHELAALRGAELTLKRFRPRLAISLYHRWEDYFTIPRFLSELGLGYKFFLDNYTISDGETILYCEIDDVHISSQVASKIEMSRT